MIKQAQDEMKTEDIEWRTLSVAEPQGHQLALQYKIQYVPTTIINGKKWFVGVTTVEQLKGEILKFKDAE